MDGTQKNRNYITRRDFIRGSCAAVGTLMGIPFRRPAHAREKPRSRVVLIRDEDVTDKGGLKNHQVLSDMLDRAVTSLLAVDDPLAAWERLVKPGDVVGIKSNVWHYLPTPRVLESTILQRLQDVGVKSGNISIDDRGVLRNPLFKRSTALINIRPMRTHHWSGLGTLIKNYIMFVPHP